MNYFYLLIKSFENRKPEGLKEKERAQEKEKLGISCSPFLGDLEPGETGKGKTHDWERLGDVRPC